MCVCTVQSRTKLTKLVWRVSKWVKIWVFITPKPYVPSHYSQTKGPWKGASLGCQLAPKVITITRNCAAPQNYPNFDIFCAYKIMYAEMFHGCMYPYRVLIHVLVFQKWSKSMQQCIGVVINNNAFWPLFGTVWQNPLVDSPQFFV